MQGKDLNSSASFVIYKLWDHHLISTVIKGTAALFAIDIVVMIQN